MSSQGDSSNLVDVGIALGAGAFGTAAESFTLGLLCTNFGTTEEFAPEPVNQVGSSLQIRKTTTPPIFLNLSLGFALDVGDNTSGNIGHFLQSIFGTDTIGESPPYTHTFTRNDTSIPTWFNLWSDKDIDSKQYRGFRVNTLTFSIDSGTGAVTVTVEGFYQIDSELATQSLTYSTSPILTAHNASIWTLGGSPNTNFNTCEITITRDNQRHKAISNIQTIDNIYSANFGIAVSLAGLDFTSETEYDKYRAKTATPFRLTLTDANSNYIDFNFPAMIYNSWTPPAPSANALLNIATTLFATEDNNEIVLQNERSTAYSA